MPTLMIRCPNTGQPVSTGLILDAGSFDSLPDKLSVGRCSLCGAEHTWLKCDARFANADSAASCESYSAVKE